MKIFETDRLLLREIIESDDAFILDLLNTPSFIKYIGDRQVRDLEQSREFIKSRYRRSYSDNGFGLYTVELKEDSTPIGICGFVKRDALPDADIGFAFLPQFERKGYAFESAAAMMTYAADVLKLTSILAITTRDNDGSVKLLKKLGFEFERLITMPNEAEKLNLFSFGKSSVTAEAD